ncbi:NADH dehydrogenase [ubiquinone] 1 beta subcomplex subunit 11, mitochondrial [Diachasma alloeum]|uniref:NADH dehydrogenase [ubiquinone] 1 beta subcomplex subunit 11, mitochondrial n=1 Tax=Diachasma alloeum TaxID=454923 RepID=UPI0007383AEC|nr:NADH dehydrogenase [ubiquinone] 1 beta subcomplex subunit 11, mitochondrial [Diachasma alloeum]
MSSLIRLGAASALKRGLARPLQRPKQLVKRPINTSSKPPQASHSTPATTVGEAPVEQSKNWVSWGFSEENEYIDRLAAHMTFFTTVSICLVLGGTLIAYAPDPKLREWSQREAYLQLRYKEEHGLPPISRNYVDPAKLYLPSDEELGDTEIII